MAGPRSFRGKQQGVATRMALAATLSAVVLAIAFYIGRDSAPLPLADRFARVLRLDLFVVVWLGAMVGNVARLRFFSAADIDGSGATSASPAVRDSRAVLQNTLEQTVLAIPVHLAIATILPDPVPFVAALVCLFGLGRLLFWIGFSRGATARALGFALTFYPTMISLLIAVLAMLAQV